MWGLQPLEMKSRMDGSALAILSYFFLYFKKTNLK